MRRSGAPIIDVASEGGVGLLPTVASHQANHGGSSSSTKKHRRASSRGSKPFQWFFRVSVGMCLLTVLTMYVMMTWHVVLLSSTTTGGNEIGIQSEALWSSHRRILYEPVLFFNVGRVDADTGKDLNRKINHGLDDSSHSLPKKPLVVGYYFSDSGPTSFLGLERLDPYLMRSYDTVNTRIRRQLMTKQERKRQEALEDSEDYADNAADTMQDQGKDCVAQYDWQESSFPACNLLMEEDMTHLLPHLSSLEGNHGIRDGANVAPPTLLSPSLASSTEVRMISHGYWRDVWSIETNKNGSKDFSETYVLKTMRYTHDYVQRNYDRHRRDAVAMERLTASPFVMNIYAACGNSGLFEYADGGSLEDSIWNEEHDTPPWSSQERLVVAYQAAAGLADLHNVGKEGVPSIAHTDISHGQFVYVNDVGVYKLNDFNRARFIGWNKKTDTPCSFRVGNNPGKVSAMT